MPLRFFGPSAILLIIIILQTHAAFRLPVRIKYTRRDTCHTCSPFLAPSPPYFFFPFANTPLLISMAFPPNMINMQPAEIAVATPRERDDRRFIQLFFYCMPVMVVVWTDDTDWQMLPLTGPVFQAMEPFIPFQGWSHLLPPPHFHYYPYSRPMYATLYALRGTLAWDAHRYGEPIWAVVARIATTGHRAYYSHPLLPPYRPRSLQVIAAEAAAATLPRPMGQVTDHMYLSLNYANLFEILSVAIPRPMAFEITLAYIRQLDNTHVNAYLYADIADPPEPPLPAPAPNPSDTDSGAESDEEDVSDLDQGDKSGYDSD